MPFFHPEESEQSCMETNMKNEEEKVAIIGIFITEFEAAAQVNELLHEYSDCIIGRIGIPYREKSVNIISVIICAAPDQISALSGKLGRIKGISAKAMQSKI